MPLHDSGQAGAFLYYVVPYIEGESLRDKLDRDKQLSIEESVSITKAALRGIGDWRAAKTAWHKAFELYGTIGDRDTCLLQ